MAVLPHSFLELFFHEETIALCELVVLWVAVTVGYFLPSLVAWRRGLARLDSVLIVNVVAGWTGIGWLMAWATALAKDRPFDEEF